LGGNKDIIKSLKSHLLEDALISIGNAHTQNYLLIIYSVHIIILFP